MHDVNNEIAMVIGKALLEYSEGKPSTAIRENVGGVDIIRTASDSGEWSVAASSDDFFIRAMNGIIENYYDSDSDFITALAWAWTNNIVTVDFLNRLNRCVAAVREVIDYIDIIRLTRGQAHVTSDADVVASVQMIGDLGRQQGMEPLSPTVESFITHLFKELKGKQATAF